MDATELFTVSSSPSFSFLLETEEDFPFGAKTTPFLPPATTTTTTAAAAAPYDVTASYNLPDWMEGREIFGLPDTFEDVSLPPLHTPSPKEHILMKLEEEEEDIYSAIKPEDMLVPLSELLPPPTPPTPPLATTPPVSPAHIPASFPQVPAPSQPLLPKIIICRKVTAAAPQARPIQINYQVLPVKQEPQVTYGTLLPLLTKPHTLAMPSQNTYQGEVAPVRIEQPEVSAVPLTVPQKPPDTPVPQGCDAEELINEMVQMIGKNSTLQELSGGPFDSLVMEASMDDLLFQLEASESDTTILDPQTFTTITPPASQTSSSVTTLSHIPTSFLSPHSSKSPVPPPVPSPHPSESSISTSLLSPHSEFHFPASPISLPSPVPSVGSLSPAQSGWTSPVAISEASFDTDEEFSPLEETHSYSRSQRKASSSHKGTARKIPYPKDRKERKKEQNKQAALRYRQKKKQEEDVMTEKVEAEIERQRQLKEKYSGLKQELSYLKKIMREVFVAKGLLSEEALKNAALEKRKKSSSKRTKTTL